MLVGHHGYVPEPYFLTETLRSQSRFHDPFQDSLFSHSGSVQGFREWSSGSGTSSPSNLETPVSKSHPTLLVRSSRPIGESLLAPGQLPHKNQPTCTKVAENIYEAHLPSLVTPRSTVPGGGSSKRIRYAVLEVRSDRISGFVWAAKTLKCSGIHCLIRVTSKSTVISSFFLFLSSEVYGIHAA